jgi:hypothetical protein
VTVRRKRILIVIAVVVVVVAAIAVAGVATHVISFGGGADDVPWAGAVVTGGSHSSVSATWVQPAVTTPAKAGSQNSFWVGLDGYGTETVEQLGTQVVVGRDGTPRYSAWWEMYPKGTVGIKGFTVAPGDVITASVTNQDGRFTLAMENKTTGRKFSTVQSSDVKQSKTAEIVLEQPSVQNGKKLTRDAYAACAPVRFTACTVDGKPLESASPKWIVLKSTDGAVLATPSAPQDGGTAFAVFGGG